MGEVDDLARERKKAQFDVEAMKIVWAGSGHAFEVADRMARLVASDPVFRKDNRAMLNRKELFRNTLRKAAYVWNLVAERYLSVRPNAVALVDAFNYTDHYLGSVLGCYDGNVYPKLYEEAWKDPLNDSVVPEGYHEYIRPLLKQQLTKSRL